MPERPVAYVGQTYEAQKKDSLALAPTLRFTPMSTRGSACQWTTCIIIIGLSQLSSTKLSWFKLCLMPYCPNYFLRRSLQTAINSLVASAFA